MSRCVRLQLLRVKKFTKNPIIRRTGRFVERHVVKSSVVSFVPSLLNDTIVHHQAITPIELLHVATDDLSVTTFVALANFLIKVI